MDVAMCTAAQGLSPSATHDLADNSGPSRHIQLDHNQSQESFNRMSADLHSVGNLLTGQTSHQVTNNLLLSGSEVVARAYFFEGKGRLCPSLEHQYVRLLTHIAPHPVNWEGVT